MLKFLNPYVILGVGGVVIVLFLYIRFLQSSRDHWKERYDEVQATLNVERATHKQAMDENEARRARDLQEATRIRNETVQHLEERIAANAGAADALRVRLAAERRLRPLAPAPSAPAECGNYESDPTRLSEPHRRFLIGEAAAAERNGDLLEACRRDYEAVKSACGVH